MVLPAPSSSTATLMRPGAVVPSASPTTIFKVSAAVLPGAFVRMPTGQDLWPVADSSYAGAG